MFPHLIKKKKKINTIMIKNARNDNVSMMIMCICAYKLYIKHAIAHVYDYKIPVNSI